MNEIRASRRKMVARLAARLAAAIRNGEGEVIDLSCDVIDPRRRRRA